MFTSVPRTRVWIAVGIAVVGALGFFACFPTFDGFAGGRGSDDAVTTPEAQAPDAQADVLDDAPRDVERDSPPVIFATAGGAIREMVVDDMRVCWISSSRVNCLTQGGTNIEAVGGTSGASHLAIDRDGIYVSFSGTKSVDWLLAGDGGRVGLVEDGSAGDLRVARDDAYFYWGTSNSLRRRAKAPDAGGETICAGGGIRTFAVDGTSVTFFHFLNSHEIARCPKQGGSSVTLDTDASTTTNVVSDGLNAAWILESGAVRLHTGTVVTTLADASASASEVAIDDRFVYYLHPRVGGGSEIVRVTKSGDAQTVVYSVDRVLSLLVATNTALFWTEAANDASTNDTIMKMVTAD